MTLRLRFQSSGSLPGGRDRIEMLGGALTIGRGEENDLALPDPDRTISKRHCVIEDRGGDYVLIDISTNGTFLNYAPERIGEAPAPLNDGDVITLGAYELVVEIQQAMAAADPFASIPPPLGEERVSPGRAADARVRDDFVGTLDDPAGTDGGDFLDDLLGSGPAAPVSPGAAPRPAWERAVIPEDPLEPAAPLPEDQDPFFRAEDADPLRQGGASEGDHLPSAQDHFAPPAASQGLIPDDWDEEFAGSAQPDAPAAPPPAARPGAPMIPDDPFDEPFAPVPEPSAPAAAPPPRDAAAPVPPAPAPTPAPVPPARAEAPPPAAPPGPAASGAGSEAVHAFLRAAGAERLNIPDEELVEVMARMGAVFRAMVEGMREVLMTRASIKGEFRMNQTMIRAGGNNPLKFSISPEQAVEAMIRPAVPGYQEAQSAAREALNDIKAHEVAMMTGMEAALKDLLRRLSPEQLTEKIDPGSGLGNLLGGRKARYWEAYERMYSEIARQAEDDFQSMFGKEFARAYENQLRKL
ncbi:type VI secretion system-associated FHA domain protein TagH [Limibaculum sp. FT325]|uniref:type VI secretion system-associated FHA domain protein TagH n=1 Tax=Thermohalobaculum sediminis TaxID=2939436 RepID=UPI0020BEB05C|nr:type VI secretion system-associated FHA domain protein TagH [Limibaculum sediminis]MCL5777312.1 type VI secretion system-associated FHA domain protein TagH [Limibaculum sediminis]